MKSWILDSEQGHFVKMGTGDRVSVVELKKFESDNHGNLRGVSGEARLERFLLSQKPALKAVENKLVVVEDGKEVTPVGVPRDMDRTIAPDALPDPNDVPPKEAASGVAELCAACGNMMHEGVCAFV